MSHPQFPDPRDPVEHRAILYPYTLPSPYFSATTDTKPDSSSSNMHLTSSLSGAVDELQAPTPPGNPPPHLHRTRSLYSHYSQSSWNSQNDVVAWSSSYPPDRATPVYQRQSPETSPDLSYTHPPEQRPHSCPYSSRPVESPTPPLFPSTFPNQTSFQSDRTTQGVSMVPCSSGSSQTYYRDHQDCLNEEIKILRKEKRDLELVNERNGIRINELERELARGNTALSTPHSGDSPTPPPPAKNIQNSSSIEMSLKARTDARIQLLCSSNRAGNALCSWHHSRRERRAYSPRMAPPGYLNCGCTYEEALFEESLSRHGVGGYRPGETVRMDPNLRRPLLRLLQRRYNYKDGDFERDPITGEWAQGEGHLLWERKLGSNSPSTRKSRTEDRR